MNDTVVTIVGNALTMPEWRRLERTGTLVTHFKVASNSRRFDRENKRWVDGDSLRVRVNCWRRLAEGVAASVKVGDPVVVTGRMYTRDWTTPEGQRRVMYELDAAAVGHDLSRGRAAFERNRPTLTTSVVEDAETDGRIQGELSESVTELNERREQVDELHNEDEPFGPMADFDLTPPPGAIPDEAETSGIDPHATVADLDDVLAGGVEEALAPQESLALVESEGVPMALVGSSARGRRRARVPVGA